MKVTRDERRGVQLHRPLPHRYLQRARIFPRRAASCTTCCGSSRPSETGRMTAGRDRGRSRGWAGAVLILLAYLLMSAGKLTGQSLRLSGDERRRRGGVRDQRLVAPGDPFGRAQRALDADRGRRIMADHAREEDRRPQPCDRAWHDDLSRACRRRTSATSGRARLRPRITTTGRASRSAASTWSPTPAPISTPVPPLCRRHGPGRACR